LTCDFFFFNETPTTEIYTLSLHDALPISQSSIRADTPHTPHTLHTHTLHTRSEEHTSELQSHLNLVCRLLLEKHTQYEDHNDEHRCRVCVRISVQYILYT